MKKCINCGSEALDEADWCMECGSRLPTEPISGAQSQSAVVSVTGHRPDGKMTQAVGLVLMILGVLLALFSTAVNELPLLIIGGGFSQLGLVLWLAGYIVNAISFLPGKGD